MKYFFGHFTGIKNFPCTIYKYVTGYESHGKKLKVPKLASTFPT